MTRIEELRDIFKDVNDADKKVIAPLLEEAAFLETRIKEVRALPMIRVHPNNPSRQEITPAGKQYRELMQTYVNVIKVLERVLTKNAAGGESKLQELLRGFVEDDFS